MAYGTESVPAVNKIAGPGNAFVNSQAPPLGPVGIDQRAGPRKLLSPTKRTSEMIATDLLAQAD